MERIYRGRHLDQIFYPMGGIGAGMICLEGTGTISRISIRHEANLYNEPNMFAAVSVKGQPELARVLEGPVPIPKVFGANVNGREGSGNGMKFKNYGLPRFHDCSFSARFPFATVDLSDDAIPYTVKIEGYSPFIPGNADDSSLPVASVKYTLQNNSENDLDAVFYFSAFQFMNYDKKTQYSFILPFENGKEKQHCYIHPVKNGFVMEQKVFDERPYTGGSFLVAANCDARVNADFYRGSWWDDFTMHWKHIARADVTDAVAADRQSPGGSIQIPICLKAHDRCTVTLRFCWYVPQSNLRYGENLEGQEIAYHRPWYAGKYTSAEDVDRDFSSRFDELYQKTKAFSEALYASELPDEIMDAVASNLPILKSPTVLRQEDGRLWGWEGCYDIGGGSCYGSCTHVWNYAQAICHLFPDLERTLRNSELHESLAQDGHQQFRTSLPIRESAHDFHAAADGQTGGIMKVYREWRISADTQWMASLWDQMITSMEYCIRTWDRKEEGVLREPHHNTYDIEFWGADGMCTSFYLGALKALSLMGRAIGKEVSRYEALYEKGRIYMESKLWNGEYFIQIPEGDTLETTFDPQGDPILMAEGPKYQYAGGCLTDGICGAWLAKMCGLGDILDTEKIKSHLLSVYKYNFRRNLSTHANTQRPGYALGDEGGVLICSWPHGGKPSLPFVYCDEVMTGMEYQVAAHLASFGYFQEAREIVATIRARYDGEKRNPYDEYECGHWYARAMASYALLQAFTGVRYDALTKTLYVYKDDCSAFLATASGYGIVTVKDGHVEVQVISGRIEVEDIVFTEV